MQADSFVNSGTSQTQGLMRHVLCTLIVLLSLGTFSAAKKKPEQTCRVNFSVETLDRLNNKDAGIPSDSAKSVEKKLRDLGDVCYASPGQSSDVLFFIHTTPTVYHGTQVYRDNSSAAVIDSEGNGAAAAVTSTTAVPYTVDYSVFILDIEKKQADGSFTVLHTFDQQGLYATYYGIGFGKGKHPETAVIEAAATWLHNK